MTVFVLVHGAFRGGWAWERVVPLLDGHPVLARVAAAGRVSATTAATRS